MLPLGHLGIGSKLATPWSKGLPKKSLLLGTILPDLLDKPLYLIPAILLGKQGAELGLISGTRTIGHTLLFMLILAAIATVRRSRVLAAIALGVGTHLFLDHFSEHMLFGFRPGNDESLTGLLWPILGNRFPVYPYDSITEHLFSKAVGFYLSAEVLGGLLLLWDYWKI